MTGGQHKRVTARPLGENVRKLMFKFVAKDSIPAGGGLLDGIQFLTSPNLRERMKKATERTFAAIDAIKAAPDNQWGDDDEAIAGAILSEIEKRKPKRGPT